MKEKLLKIPNIQIVAVDYIDDLPTPVFSGRANVNGITIVFDVCNNRCDYLEISDDPEFNPLITADDHIMIDDYYDIICDFLRQNIPTFYEHHKRSELI